VTRLSLVVCILSASLFAFIASTPGVRAATNIESATVENNYPASLTFKVTAHSDSNITDIALSYAIKGSGTGAIGRPQSITPARDLSAEVQVQTRSQNSYIPVGSEFVYHWEITSDDGTKFVSPDTSFLYLPTGQDWQSVNGDFMTVYYHGNNQQLANAYLQAGLQTWDKMGVKLLKTQLTQVPVKVILFNDEAESSQARPPTSAKFDATTTTCGTKVAIDIVLVIPLSCGTPDRTDTLRHEFTHIINQTAGESALGKLPSWLDEGTAVYGQTTPGDNFTGAVVAAVRANRLLPLSTMGIAPSDPNNVNLFYGQSYTMVKYLIDTYGPDKYAAFFANIKKGGRFDDAMKATYGFDQAGFETEFRAANGLPPLQQQASPTGAARTNTPARSATAPATAARPTAAVSTSSDSGGISTTALVIIGVAVLFVLLAVLSYLASVMLANNRKGGGSGGAPPPTEPPAE
jgi:hypothetical protein